MKTSKFFKPVEFERCTPSCSIEDMDQNLLDMLDALREECGIPLLLSCAYRSPEWDRAKKRSGTGAHTLGRAVDIRCNSSATRMKIMKAALKVGFRRIGIEGSFIHVDNSPRHDQDIIWTY